LIASELQILGSAQSSSAPTPTSSSIPRLQRHEILAAKVLRSLPGGATLLSIKGKQVPVKTHLRLQAGQSVTLRVKSLSPATILQLVAETGPHVKAGRMATLLNALAENTWKLTLEAILQSRSGKPALRNILALLQDNSQGLFRNPGSDLLSLLISKAGFSLESKLKKAVLAPSRSESQLEVIIQNDLKALLIKAIGQETQPQKQLKQLLSVIENVQLLNQEGLQKGGRIFVPIPIQFEDGFFTMGQLLIGRDQSEQQAQGSHAAAEPIYTARLQLTLSRLGTVRAEIKLCAKRLSLSFLVTNPTSKALIERQLKPFVQTLTDKGFEFNLAACTIADPETDMEDLISEFMPAETNILCLTA
jgi:hypothetical protein